MPLVIAACSNRKRLPPAGRAGGLPVGTVALVGTAWLKLLAAAERWPASELYCGRSVRASEQAARSLGGDLLFASAGLGWVSSHHCIPSYGMTIIEGDDNILRHVSNDLTATDWWGWLNRHSPFATSLAAELDATEGVVLIALPRAYLAMVTNDVLGLSEALRNRLRIIQRAGAEIADLAPWTLVYDDRLEGVAGYAGTRSDFAARAAIHFAEQVWPGREGEDLGSHNIVIEMALAASSPRVMRSGARRGDEALRAIIAEHWDAADGRTTKLLRVLRDELGIACEQGRFARLVSAMRTEREAAE